MIPKALLRLKPGVHRQTHLLLAAMLWTGIGCMLMLRGILLLTVIDKYWVFLVAIIVGTLKSLLILDKTARKGIRRILNFSDGTCLGAVYSIHTWLLVLIMIGSGILLRRSSLPRELLGGLYAAIGWALFFSSRHAWLAWHHFSQSGNKP